MFTKNNKYKIDINKYKCPNCDGHLKSYSKYEKWYEKIIFSIFNVTNCLGMNLYFCNNKCTYLSLEPNRIDIYIDTKNYCVHYHNSECGRTCFISGNNFGSYYDIFESHELLFNIINLDNHISKALLLK